MKTNLKLLAILATIVVLSLSQACYTSGEQDTAICRQRGAHWFYADTGSTNGDVQDHAGLNGGLCIHYDSVAVPHWSAPGTAQAVR